MVQVVGMLPNRYFWSNNVFTYRRNMQLFNNKYLYHDGEYEKRLFSIAELRTKLWKWPQAPLFYGVLNKLGPLWGWPGTGL